MRPSLGAILIAVLALGCNGQGAAQPEVADVRDDVLAGARDDFRHTEGVPPEFVDCFLPELRRALDPRSLEWLGAIRAEYGQPAAARAQRARRADQRPLRRAVAGSTADRRRGRSRLK